MLGVWNLAKNEANALQLLEQAVAFPTFYSDDYPNQYDNPEFIRFGEFINTIATDFGLSYRNVALSASITETLSLNNLL